MTAQTIYLDECGYTGEDLLNRDQPVFVVCTHSIDEAECARVKATHFAGVTAGELKHSRLSKRPAQRRMVIAAVRDLFALHSSRIKVGISHKRYALTMKIVDLLVETSMHAAGLDLYRQRRDIAMTNAMYACMGLDQAYLDGLLARFQAAVRERTGEACAAFTSYLSGQHPLEDVDCFRRLILGALYHVGFAGVFNGLAKNALDLSLSTAFHLIGIWRDVLGSTEIRVVHDTSINMSRQQRLWDVLVSPDARPAIVGFAGRTKSFPLGVGSTSFEASLSTTGLQIADVVAGALGALWCARSRGADDEYVKELEEVFPDTIGGYLLWPSTDVTPEALGTLGGGGENPLDYIAERISKMPRR